jgi:hypothetical protein
LEPELAPPSGLGVELALAELTALTAPRPTFACVCVRVSVPEPLVNVGSVGEAEDAVPVPESPLAVFESAPCVCAEASVETAVRLADAVSFVAAPALPLALALAGFPSEVAPGFWFWFWFCAVSVSVGRAGGAFDPYLGGSRAPESERELK